MSIALYVETDGQADSPEAAIADAALAPDSIPFEEGDVVEVKIEATWTTPDGKHHAKVSLVKQTKPELTDTDKDIQNKNVADNKNQQPVLDDELQDVDEDAEPVSGNKEYKSEKDPIKDNISEGQTDSADFEEIAAATEALKGTAPDAQNNPNISNEIVTNENVTDPNIEMPKDNLTDNDPTNLESSALELTSGMAAAEKGLENDFAESRDPNSQRSRDLVDEPAPEEGYNSEGLRRDSEPAPEGAKKAKPQETP